MKVLFGTSTLPVVGMLSKADRARMYYFIPQEEVAKLKKLQPKRLAKQLAWQGHNGTPPQEIVVLESNGGEKPYRVATFRMVGSPAQYSKDELARLVWFSHKRYPAFRTEKEASENAKVTVPILIEKQSEDSWTATRTIGQNGKPPLKTQSPEAIFAAIERHEV